MQDIPLARITDSVTRKGTAIHSAHTIGSQDIYCVPATYFCHNKDNQSCPSWEGTPSRFEGAQGTTFPHNGRGIGRPPAITSVHHGIRLHRIPSEWVRSGEPACASLFGLAGGRHSCTPAPTLPPSHPAGIPKFYRWLSERYPLINQPGGATVVPIIDNLYLDMNGIIHNCTHGNNPDVRLTEDEMILRIFTYLDKIFHIVKPQKLLFMAIDGEVSGGKVFEGGRLFPKGSLPCNH